MSSWLQAQLKVAEGLLESVDRTISKTVGTAAQDGHNEGQDSSSGSYVSRSLTQDPPAFAQAPLPSSTTAKASPEISSRSSDASNAQQVRQLSFQRPAEAGASETSHGVGVGHAHAHPSPSGQQTHTNGTPPQHQLSQDAWIVHDGPPPFADATSTVSAQRAQPPPPSTSVTTASPTLPHAAAINTAIARNAPSGSEQLDSSMSGPSTTAASQQGGAATKLVEQLRKRLDVAKQENEQLEDLLHRTEKRAEQEHAMVQQLNAELAALQEAKSLGETSLQAQLQAQQASQRDLSSRLESAQRQVLKLEATVTALEDSNRNLMEGRNGLEGGMLEALKSELSASESRLEAEVRAHQATKAASVARERELEGQLAESGAVLADVQRSLHDTAAKARDLEDQVALLESARKELLDKVAELQQAAGGGGSATSPLSPGSAAADAALLQSLRLELGQQRRAAQQAEAALAAAEARLREKVAEVDALKSQLEHYAAKKDTSQLEAQLREATDILFLKQTQMERLAADKAAQQLKLEREVNTLRDELVKLRQQAAFTSAGDVLSGRGAAALGSERDAIIPMDALGAPYQRLVQHNQVGKAVKAAATLVDSTACAAAAILRQYPLARLLIFGYLVFIHLYVYVLIARLQGSAVSMEVQTSSRSGNVLPNSTSVSKL